MTTWNGIFFQNPSSFIMELVSVIHDYVSIFLVSILILVFINLAYSFILKRFNLEFYENHQLERIWTLVPFFLLIFIVIPSLTSLYILDSCLFCGITISIIGHQWYWRYFYKDLKDYFFDSYIIPSSERVVRLLDVDNRLIIPTFLPVRFLVSSSDVIHSWTIPSFGLKIDAVPGRINQFCFLLNEEGFILASVQKFVGLTIDLCPSF